MENIRHCMGEYGITITSPECSDITIYLCVRLIFFNQSVTMYFHFHCSQVVSA